MNDVALILAAGASRRLGEPKQLLIVDGESLVARAVRIAREAGLHPVVVTGCEAERVAAETDAHCVYNEAWAEGMGRSIATGVAAVADGASSITIMTCDQLHVTSENLRQLAVAEAEVTASAYEGIQGVPARFAPQCYPELMRLAGDVGARSLIRQGKFSVIGVAMVEARFDVDEPDDL